MNFFKQSLDQAERKTALKDPVLPFPAFLPKRQGRALKDKEKGPKGKENPKSLPFRVETPPLPV